MNKKIFSIAAIILGAACIGGTIAGMTLGKNNLVKETNTYKQAKDGTCYFDFYLSQNGCDDNSGTQTSPLKTLNGVFTNIKGRKGEIESYNKKHPNQLITNINVYLAGGNHFIDETNYLTFDGSYLPEDVAVTVTSKEGERAVINGGKEVTNWTEATLNGKNVLKAQLEKNLDGIFSLYVNGKTAELANSMSSKDFDSCNLSTQNKHKHCEFDNEGSFAWTYWDNHDIGQAIKVTSNVDKVNSLANPSQTQMVWLTEWKEHLANIEKVEENGTKITSSYFKTIMSEYVQGKDSQYYYPHPNHRFYLQNDISLINREGEFCYNKASGEIYYYPLAGQNKDNIKTFIPLASKLVDIKSTAKLGLVKNVTFKDIDFMNSKVDYIDVYGGASIVQAEYMTTGPYNAGSYNRGLMGSTLTFSFCSNLKIEGCHFVNLGLNCIELKEGCKDCTIVGNTFSDCGNCAIVVSNPNAAKATDGQLCARNSIENNCIRRIGQINLSAPAILSYYTEANSIVHNDIYQVPYTGISQGWGWASYETTVAKSNTIAFNKIGHVMLKLKDGGSIYTLGPQPLSKIEYNYLYSQHNNFAFIYLDEGTRGYTVTNNAVYADGLIDEFGKFLQNEEGEDWTEFYKEPTDMHWLNLNDLTGKAGTVESPMKDIAVVTNYYCCQTGYGKTISHPDNIIPPVLNDDPTNPELRNTGFDEYTDFFADSYVKRIINLSGVEEDYKSLLDYVR